MKLIPLFLGGGQEYGLRSGTENLAGILGFAKALDLLEEGTYIPYIKNLRDTFEKCLIQNISGVLINGSGSRIANVSNLYFPQIDAETLLIALDQKDICASHGSACSTGSLEPSRVLLNMGFPYKRARHSVRFSFSRLNTLEEVSQTVQILTALHS